MAAPTVWLLPPDAGPVVGQESGGEESTVEPDDEVPCYWPYYCTPTPTPVNTPVPTPVPTTPPTAEPTPVLRVNATLTRTTSDDVSVRFRWITSASSESSETWAITLQKADKHNGDYTTYRSAFSPSSGTVSFLDVTTGKWYRARVRGCKGQTNCASVDSSKVKVPPGTPDPPTPTPSGKLTATPTTIERFATTKVTATDLSPSSVYFRIEYPDTLQLGTNCSTRGTGKRYTTRFKTTTNFTFSGCKYGVHTLRLLTETGNTALATASITVATPTPTPTPTPNPPTVRITKVFPGTTGVYVEFQWSPKPADSLSELTLHWGQTSGILCRPQKPCPGQRAIPTTSPSAAGYTVQGDHDDANKNDDFVHDSDYTKFKVVAKGTWSGQSYTIEGHYRDSKSKDKFIRTHRTPEMIVKSGLDGRYTGENLSDVKWGALDYATVGLEGTVRASEYQVAMHAASGTGFQVKKLPTESCVYAPGGGDPKASSPSQPNLPPAPSAWQSLDNATFYLVRCTLGNSDADLTLLGRVSEGNATYSVGAYAEIKNVPPSWHQHDNKVTYFVIGTEGENIRATTTRNPVFVEGMFPEPTRGEGEPNELFTKGLPNVFAIYDTAAAAWQNLKGGVTLARSTISLNVDVKIRGYFAGGEVHPNCTAGSVACVLHPSGAVIDEHNHEPRNQTLWIEEPPQRGRNAPTERWTIDVEEWQKSKPTLEYLPGTLAHEIGHVVGFGHANVLSSVMMTKEFETCSGANLHCITLLDVKALRAIYANHEANH